VVEQLRIPRRTERDHRLFGFGLLAVAGWCAYFVYTWHSADVINLYQGLVILILACVPALQWAYRGESSFPLMEAYMLTTANSYAVPLLTGHESLLLYNDAVIFNSANVVIYYQVTLTLTYNLVRGRAQTSEFWVKEVISEEFSQFLSYGMIATTIYTFLATFFHDLIFDHLPRESEGILRAVFFGLGIICTFITCRRWGMGVLRPSERVSFTFNLVVQFIIVCSSLFLISGISLIVLALLGYISGSRRVPVVLILALLPVIAVLHHGKTAMREKYWDNATHYDVQLGHVTDFYLEWVGHGLTADPENKRSQTSRLIERTSLLQILCLVVDRTPEKQDYLWGETYKHIPGQFIPRYFWPDKPVGHISTYRLSVYYGLQNEEDTKATTIAFGTISEAYANFGTTGVILLAVVMGTFYKKISVWTRHSPMLSYGGLLLVILMAWSFQTELTLSIWLSSLFQACVAVLGIPLLVRSFLN
jgi:hypothetical protein